MTEADIRQFFDGYAEAFTALDVAGILDRFQFPCQIVSEDGGYAFADRTAIEADMRGFVQSYADKKFGRAELAGLAFQPLSETFGLAHVKWRLIRSDGALLVAMHSTYILRIAGKQPAIIGILGHDEDSAWKRWAAANG